MRIAIISTSYPTHPGDAAGHFVEAEARALSLSGHTVTVFAAGRTSELATNPRVVRLRDGGAMGSPGLKARLGENPLRSLGLGAWLLQVRREVRERGPFDRLILHWLLPSAIPLLFLLQTGGVEVEIVVHGSDARLLASLPRPLARYLLDRVLRRGPRIRCVSLELAKLLEQLAGPSIRAFVDVEPALLDLSFAPSRATAREELGIADDTRLAVVVGRLISGKQTADALAAAALVPDLAVVIVGDGPLRWKLEATFRGARFVGQLGRRETLAWIAASDVLISASRSEGAPTVVREARALGVPVAACASGDLKHWAETDPGLFVIA